MIQIQKKQKRGVMRCVPKDSRKADTNLFLYRLFSVVPPIWVVSKCALAGRLYKPPSEREGDRVSGGRSLRDLEFEITSTWRALPHPTPSGAPSRREPFLSPESLSVFLDKHCICSHKRKTRHTSFEIYRILAKLSFSTSGWRTRIFYPSHRLCMASRHSRVFPDSLRISWKIGQGLVS